MVPLSQVFRPGTGVVDVQRFARCARERRARVLRRGVDGVVTGQLDRPAIVVVLPRKEKRIGIAVAFGRGVAVVFVGAEGVQAETQLAAGSIGRAL